MKIQPSSTLLFVIGALLILSLSVVSIISPPVIMSDPGSGFYDLFNFEAGGDFMKHLVLQAPDADKCTQEMTTWWSPGQWVVPWLFMKIGFSLGHATVATVMLASIAGLFGWYEFYRCYKVNIDAILYSLIAILFSRYFIASFQIYIGGGVLEFAAGPWLAVLWKRVENKSILLQCLILFAGVFAGYFLKSSLLIFWLALIVGREFNFSINRVLITRAFVFIFVFVLAKYLFEYSFDFHGPSPISVKSSFLGGNSVGIAVLIQRFFFTIAAPLLSGVGAEDYIKYLVQRPGNRLWVDGSLPLIVFYGIVACFMLVCMWRLFRKSTEARSEFERLLIVVLCAYYAFFLYTLVAGKPVSSYEDSRHFRLAGIMLLPLLFSQLLPRGKFFLRFMLVCMLIYGVASTVDKASRKRVVSKKHDITLTELVSANQYQHLLDRAQTHDLVYVIHPDLGFELKGCRGLFLQDDFTSLPQIMNRTKFVVSNKRILFFLPRRFGSNGKRDAILKNFVARGNNSPTVASSFIGDWEYISVVFP